MIYIMPESTISKYIHTPTHKCVTDGLLVPKEDLEVGVVIGKGTFGTVHRGSYLGTEVAVKVIHVPDEDIKKTALKEITILK